ncbi:hypothetical protein GQ457_10G020510 [Hibiscus cannabinus]
MSMREERKPLFDNVADISKLKTCWFWFKIREKKAGVQCHKILWFILHIPKHAIVSWMSILDRLPTKDRLLRMGLEVDTRCLLCDDGIESRNHLFFYCVFPRLLWEGISRLCNIHRAVSCWEEELLWVMQHLRGSRRMLTFIPFGRNEIAGNSKFFANCGCFS